MKAKSLPPDDKSSQEQRARLLQEKISAVLGSISDLASYHQRHRAERLITEDLLVLKMGVAALHEGLAALDQQLEELSIREDEELRVQVAARN